MFELYDIFDDNEINIILLCIFVFVLVIIVIGLAYYDYRMKQKLNKVESKLKDITDTLDINLNNNNMFSDIKNSDSNSDENYKQKYEELLKEKDVKQSHSMQYSPSEYATLLKYNPILPYSAFTMDIINNAYLDMNERGMYEDKYFALSNYDNIYDRASNNTNVTNNNTSGNNSVNNSGNTGTNQSSSNNNPNTDLVNNNSAEPETDSQNADF